jgi:hypothetical protein
MGCFSDYKYIHNKVVKGFLVYIRILPNKYFMPWWRRLVDSSPPDIEQTGAMGREIESRQGKCRVVGS